MKSLSVTISRRNQSRYRTNKKNRLKTAEMKILQNLRGYTLLDRKRNKDVRAAGRFKMGKTKKTIMEWTRYENAPYRIPKIGDKRNNKPNTRWPMRRPPKRWADSFTSSSQEQQTKKKDAEHSRTGRRLFKKKAEEFEDCFTQTHPSYCVPLILVSNSLFPMLFFQQIVNSQIYALWDEK